MLPLIIVGISCALLGGFIILTALERRHGRLFGEARKKLDRWVGRVTYIARHVDWSSFVKDIVHSSVERVVHDIAHASLKLVRFLERLLTRLVRSLRERRVGQVTREPRQRVSVHAILQTLKKRIPHFPKRSKKTEE